MTIEDYIQDAIELIDSWEVPESDWADAASDKARLMAGIDLETNNDIPVTSPYHARRF
jgi:hypothetical protein